MKKIVIVILMLFNCYFSFCQEKDKVNLSKIYQKLDSIDRKSIRTQNFLNKGFLLGQFRKEMIGFFENDKEYKIIFTDEYAFKSNFIGIKNSEMGKRSLVSDPQIILTEIKKKEEIVPFGIIYSVGEWLDEYEIEENIHAVKRGYQPSKIYDTIPIIDASPLISDVYTKNVNFFFDSTLFVSKKNVKILADFYDGRGFQEVVKNQKIEIYYPGPGEKSITVKFVENNYVTFVHSKINVNVFEGSEPDYIFDIPTISSLSSVGGRIENLSGGIGQLFNGCDFIFDKPVIIVEGFDAGNLVGIEELRSRYLSQVDVKFRNNGYDVIYLNFSNGGADIRTNAQVLERLILDVKQRKSGNNKIIVIGESMGGLVARYSLSSMESRNIQHGVSHFISFDSPHKGANVPVGFQKMAEDLDDIDLLNLFNIAQTEINDALFLLNSTAAKQMLLRYKGPSPHAEFLSLQNDLNQFGFPSQAGIRNIAIINGSSLGTQQSPVSSFVPNSLMLDINYVSPVSAFVKIATNNLNTNSTVSSIQAYFSGIPTTSKVRTFNFDAFNYDIASGGYQTNQGIGNADIGFWKIFNILELFEGFQTINTYGRDFFSFVPLFSSLASAAPRTQQSHLNYSVSHLQSNGLTPFQAIYSNNSNSKHVIDLNDISLPWTNLLSNEFNISSFFCASGTSAPPPAPRFNTTQWFMCPNQSLNFWITDDSAVGNLYNHTWQVTGPNNFLYSSTSDQIFLSSLAPGAYTITLIRTYSGGVVSNFSSSTSRVLNVYPSGDTNCGGGGGGPIERIMFDDSSQEKISKSIPPVEIITKITFWPNPASKDLNILYKVNKSSNVQIDLIPASSSNSGVIPLSFGYRPVGDYNEKFAVDHIPSGLYIIQIQTEEQILQKRLILN
ncbi:T9SS type A sorting domain-containing protein [Algoriphagus sp. AK58]|uniref:alpha/beta hydrolase n=1 Tax=Algoriphagus sp. AK58 TaxID=1406877 RepID=UPI001650276D|nr:T9SS type A sorting domain-containing protein [Algoriphagus sp. AK58]MBC6369162.1 hypothetical protein [Algoriphagus sp. AK58]